MARFFCLTLLSLCSFTSGFLISSARSSSSRNAFECAAVSRREALSLTSSIFAVTVFVQPVMAKEELPITSENIDRYFNDVRYELEDPEGGISLIEKALTERDWSFIKTFTQGYDLELRKKKMGYARKMMSDKKMKSDTLMLRNGVTFDLIAINKAARVQDADACLEAIKLLKDDVNQFLAFKDLIKLT